MRILLSTVVILVVSLSLGAATTYVSALIS